MNEYIRLHTPRFKYLARRVAQYNPETILAVAGGIECDFIQEALPHCKITVAGLDKYKDYDFVYLDLNQPYHIAGDYDMIIACEVIEHIKTSPYVFTQACLHAAPVVIITTPNACALWIRVRCLFGQSPWEICTEHLRTDSHLYEYTLADPGGWAENSEITCINYFNHKAALGLYRHICNLLPASLRDGIFAVFTR